MQPDSQQALDLLIDAVRIPSPSGHETEVAMFLAERMTAFGFDSHIDNAGNVIGEIGDKAGPQVVLLGHMDTIATLLPTTLTDSQIAGRGTVDATGSLCCFICAAAAFHDAPVRFIVIGAVEEETTSRGAWALRGTYDPEIVFIGEPSGSDGITIGYKGRIGGRISHRTSEGHAAGPQDNASVAAVRYWSKIVQYCEDRSQDTRLFDRPAATITKMVGDSASAEIDFDIRIPEGFDIGTFLTFTSEQAGGGYLRLDEAIKAVRAPRSCLPVRALSASIRAAHLEPKIKIKSGTCDMNVVSEFWGAPAVAYGPGDSRLDHTIDEHLSFAEYLTAIDILRDALSRVSNELCTQSENTNATP